MKVFKLILFFSVFLIFSCSDDTYLTSELPSDQIEKRQYIIDGFQPITPCEAGSLTYYYEPCFEGTGYANAIPASMNAYNDLATSLFFTQVDNPEDADMIFNCADDEDAECGEAAASFPRVDGPFTNSPHTQTHFPSGGTIGKDIDLQINWDLCICTEEELTHCFFMHTVMHEVAHALGLYHNDISIYTPFYNDLNPIYVSGTTTDIFDPGSIINAGGDIKWCDPVCEFNDNDILALQQIYPEPEILVVEENCEESIYIFCLPGDMEGSWYESPKLFPEPQTSPLPKNCETYNFDNPGTYTISVNVCGEVINEEIIVEDCI